MWNQRPYNQEEEVILLKKSNNRLLSRLLSQRHINDVDRFVSSDYNNLSNPNLLNDVEKAVKIFVDVAKNKGEIASIGDFDCDGIISSIILRNLCNIFKLKCLSFIPDRIEHGYGLNERTISAFKKKLKSIPDLLFVLDCGSNSEKEIKELKEFGIKKIIVIDHHTIDEGKRSVSADAFISWHLSKTPEMCTCGEIFQFIRGMRWVTRKVNPLEFLTYAAIGTLADNSPLHYDNRIIVKNGLKSEAINYVGSSGLHALLKNSGIYNSELTQEQVSFKIVPKLNACGRIAKPDISFNLLMEKDPSMAELMAKNIEDINTQRKMIQKEVEKEAVAIVKENIKNYTHGIAVFNPNWHIGVLGIVASKLAESFKKPSLVFGKNGSIIRGSGRTILDINLKEILDSCRDSFDNYGGHKYAAGITLKSSCIDSVGRTFDMACKKYYESNYFPKEIYYYDAELKPESISSKITELLLKNLYPYCNYINPEPVFLISNVVITDTEVIEGEGWKLLKFNLVKNGNKIDWQFKTFTKNYGTEINGMVANIYFKFPHDINDMASTVMDIIIK